MRLAGRPADLQSTLASTPMTPSILAAVGVACLASVVWLARAAPPSAAAILDRTYR